MDHWAVISTHVSHGQLHIHDYLNTMTDCSTFDNLIETILRQTQSQNSLVLQVLQASRPPWHLILGR